MSGDKFNLLPVQESDGQRIVDLRKRVTDLPVPEKNNIEFWRWENLQGPYGKSLAMLAEYGEEAVSHFSALPRPIHYAGKTYNGALSVESMTDKRFRGRLLFPRIWMELRPLAESAGIDIFFGFPNKNSRPIFQKGFKWLDVGSPDIFACPLNLKTMLKSRNRPLTYFFDLFGQIYRKLFRITQGTTLNCEKEFDNRFNGLLREPHDDSAIIPARSIDYLNWRYKGAPGRNYNIYSITTRDKARVEGYVVTSRARHDGIELGIIMDIQIAREVSRKRTAGLLASSLFELYKSGAQVALCLAMPGDPIRRILFSAGLLPVPQRFSPQQFNLMTYICNKDLPDCNIVEPRNWRITFGDIDVF